MFEIWILKFGIYLIFVIFLFPVPEKADHIIDVILHGFVGSFGVTTADGLVDGLVLL